MRTSEKMIIYNQYYIMLHPTLGPQAPNYRHFINQPQVSVMILLPKTLPFIRLSDRVLRL